MKKFLSRLGLGPHLAIMTAVLMLLLTLAVIQIIGATVTRQMEADIGHSLEELAFHTADKLDRGMFERYREVQVMAERQQLGDDAVPVDVKRAMLESMQRSYPYYAWIGLTDNQGRVKVASGKLLEGADVSGRPWFGNAYRNIHLTDVHEAMLLAKLLPNPSSEPKRFFDIAFPYRGKEGKIAGVLGIHLSWQWAREVERSVLRPVAARKKVETLIVDKSGMVLLGPDELRDARLSQESFARAQGSKSGFVAERWPDGKIYLVGFSKSEGHRSYPGLGWTVLVRQELDDAYRPVHELHGTILWGGLAAAFVFALLVFFVAGRITQPLRSIARFAQDIGSGKAEAIPATRRSFREVEVLAESLNALLKKLAANDHNLRELNASLEARVEQRTTELQSSERRVRAIIDTALDAFVGVDSQGNITDWNPQAEATFGWKREEVLGRPVAATIVPARFRQAHESGMARFSRAGSSGVVGSRLQLFALRRNGEEFPVEMTIGLIDAGNTHFFGTFIQDISDRKKAEDDLAKERELLNAVLDTIDVGVVACDHDGRLSLFNRATKAFHGLPLEADLSCGEWGGHYSLFHADGKTPMKADEIPLARALSGEVLRDDEMLVRSRSGVSRSLLASGRSLITASGVKLGAVVVMKDITERKKVEQELQLSRQRLVTITDNMPVTILYVDQEERYRFSNKTYEAWFERPAYSIYGKTIQEVFREQGYGQEVYDEVRQGVRRALSGQRVHVEMQRLIHGEYRHLESIYIPDWNDHGGVDGFYAMIHDITARKNQELHFEHHATHDALTGLCNRRAFKDRLEQAMARAQRRQKPLAVLFLDLNRFKQINDTYGHAAGDQVLIAFAERLKKCVRKSDTVARLAGDEFVIIAEDLAQAEEGATAIAEKIIQSLAEPLLAGDAGILGETSIGIALHLDESESADELLSRADQAMYRAKQEKTNSWWFWQA